LRSNLKSPEEAPTADERNKQETLKRARPSNDYNRSQSAKQKASHPFQSSE